METPSNIQVKPGFITRFFRWLFSWRIMRRALIALVSLVTLIALLITEENWRGKHAWENYKRDREARGEHFNAAGVAPPPVPDDQNFFATPIVSNIFVLNGNEVGELNKRQPSAADFKIYRGDSKNWPTNGGGWWQKQKFTDLTPWQRYFRSLAESTSDKAISFPVAPQPQTPAADVVLALSLFDSAVEDLRQAAQRPYSRLPFNYENGFEDVGQLLPYMAGLKRCAQMLQLRAIAELNNGQSQKALDDVKLMLRVTDSIRNQPLLISHLVRIAIMSITLQPIYEGLAQHQWSEGQLANLEQELVKLDFLADYQTAMRGEKACAIDAIETLRITREQKTFSEESGTNRIVTISYRFMPSAFFYQTELSIVRSHEELLLPLVDLENRVVSPIALRKATAAVDERKKRYSPYKILATMGFSAVGKSVLKFAITQSDVDLARVACALERYRLAHGNYPESLDLLGPQFVEKLPHDIINGQPLKYRGTDDGQFILYSVGWNESDDGGKIAFTKGGSIDREKGDWVWKYPAK